MLRLSLGKLLVNLLQVVKRTIDSTRLIPQHLNQDQQGGDVKQSVRENYKSRF